MAIRVDNALKGALFAFVDRNVISAWPLLIRLPVVAAACQGVFGRA